MGLPIKASLALIEILLQDKPPIVCTLQRVGDDIAAVVINNDIDIYCAADHWVQSDRLTLYTQMALLVISTTTSAVCGCSVRLRGAELLLCLLFPACVEVHCLY